ncbi:hypothetical protein Shell_0966 [Staphylothermus hellenicus DSM 12710]|uniref:Uncharacterized protein n=1 Tax=Staphylothermus hellenicus (strain DSM 12710 / JCM 10830 / BK20S6-10-b1 / P8) TaxID=591019 RepID=D7D8H6_STAHD|nr:hypothetical protein Shell_0966 [Staphylothermus hellenicus DSM 12710]
MVIKLDPKPNNQDKDTEKSKLTPLEKHYKQTRNKTTKPEEIKGKEGVQHIF